MANIILSEYQSIPSSIRTDISSGNWLIPNEQHNTILKSEINISNSFEREFEGRYQGENCPIYNCHGLTFASRRTGIYDNSVINKILSDEYIEIKNHNTVIIGDIILYFDKERDISHSGIVVEVRSNPLDIFYIKILSKVLRAREIVHHYNKGPYFKGVDYIKFYRINHNGRFTTHS